LNNPRILIIGLGNIGKRHLESFVKLDRCLHIYCVDIKFIEKEVIIGNKKIVYSKTLKKFKKDFNVCVISTNSKDRFNIVRSVLKKYNCKKIILEKVSFSNISQYKKALNLKNTSTKIFLNCPRRTWLSYIDLRKRLGKDKIRLFEVNGYNWGLLSNAIHFIDLFSFLTNDKKIEYIYQDCTKIKTSKRSGYFETNGSLIFQNSKDSLLMLNDHKYFKDDNYIMIKTDNKIFEIKENKNLLIIKNQKNKIINKVFFKTYLQSELSKDYLNNIKLIKLKNSMTSHTALFNCFKEIFPKKINFPVS